LGVGSDDGDPFRELRLRPAYHDLLDDDGGYTRGAEINFFDVTLRFRESDDSLILQDFTPVDIVSLVPRNRFVRPVSWKVAGHLTRSRLAVDDEPLVFRIDGGAGIVTEVNDYGLLFGFIEGSLDTSGHLEKNFALGVGPGVGLLWTYPDRFKTMMTMRALRYAVGDTHTRADAGIWQNVRVTTSTALRYGITRRREFDNYWNEAEIALLYYFR
jgi:hypothetical protein